MERDKNFEKSFGDKVRELRQKLGWSQQVLADNANIEKNQIQRVELAKHTTTLAIITAIARALGKQPFEVVKADYQIKVNKHLDSPKRRRLVTTSYIREIAATPFLSSPRSVDEIVKHCEEKYDITVPSSATSGVLKKLADEKVIERIPSKIRGRYLYQRVG